jgi:hypothetical protein
MNFNSGKKVFRLKRWKKIRLQDLADEETQKRILNLIDNDEALDRGESPHHDCQGA